MKRNLFIFHQGTITDEKPTASTLLHSPSLTPFYFHRSPFFASGQINLSIKDTLYLDARSRSVLAVFIKTRHEGEALAETRILVSPSIRFTSLQPSAIFHTNSELLFRYAHRLRWVEREGLEGGCYTRNWGGGNC